MVRWLPHILIWRTISLFERLGFRKAWLAEEISVFCRVVFLCRVSFRCHASTHVLSLVAHLCCRLMNPPEYSCHVASFCPCPSAIVYGSLQSIKRLVHSTLFHATHH